MKKVFQPLGFSIILLIFIKEIDKYRINCKRPDALLNANPAVIFNGALIPTQIQNRT